MWAGTQDLNLVACVTLEILSLGVVERVTDRDNFMSANEAKEFGLVDHVLSHQVMEKEGESEQSAQS